MRSALLTFLVLLPSLASAQFAVLNVGPTHLSFIISGKSPVPPSQQVRIRNTGSGSLGWRAASSAPWLKVSPAEGTAPSLLIVSIDTASLAIGDHAGRVTVTATGDADDSPATIEVAVQLVAPGKAPGDNGPQPGAPPDTGAPAATAPAAAVPSGTAGPDEGGTPDVRLTARTGALAPVTFNLQLEVPAGRQARTWSARSDKRWLTFEPQRGMLPGTITIKASPAGMPEGELKATLQILDADLRPLMNVPVTLTIGNAGQPDSDRQVLALMSNTMPPVSHNLPYSQAIPVRGGRPPYTMRLLQGRLPAGMMLANGAISGMARTPGRYQFVIGVTDSSTPPQAFTQQMTLRVLALLQNTALMVSPASARIMVVGAQRPQPVRLNVWSGAQPLDWHATTDVPWLRLVPADGESPAVIQLEVMAEGLASGTYMATLTVMMEGAPNSPARIPVQVVVRK